MRFSLDNDDGGDAFSTCFSDLVFGLLFFFFCFSLVMIFNRPDVKEYQKEEERLREEIRKRDKIIEQLKAIIEQWKIKYRSLQEELDKTRRELEDLREKYERLLKMYEKLLEEHQMTFSENARVSSAMRNLEEENRRLKRELEQLQQSFQELREKYRKILQQAEKYKQIFEQVKEMLKSMGKLDILAEVEAIELGEEEDAGEDEGPEPEVSKVYVKLFGPNDVQVKVMKGESVVSEANMGVAELKSILGEIKNEYAAEAAQMQKESDRIKYAPRMFLQNNPEIPYGQVQAFLQDVQKLIPVSIQGWSGGGN